ncbi:GxxExxY protein [Wenzhouxiangella sp. XN201]|uniref:GxxExxY protein n=1 Tax=Wenzhouxiangella sp. XN201 TaxID=2710755 RepID=UPI0013C841C1|nr:GxxExxY protein [Wenzhouxiangella sp. XN201]NEZ05175.1 GxxExxY protein [Wenzhouxiangella sp. XN201]
MNRSELEGLARETVDCVFKVHSALGPGLLESAYQACLAHELQKRGYRVATEVLLPLRYDGLEIEKAFRVDMLVHDTVLIENKVTQEVLPVHKSQVFTYLKLTGLQLGLLINWNTRLIKHGISRVVNNL